MCTLKMMMKDRSMLTLLIVLSVVCGLNSASVVRTPFLVPIAKPPPPSISPTLTPTLPAAIQQNNLQGLVFNNKQAPTTPFVKHSTPKTSGCPSPLPVISRSVPCKQRGFSKIDLSDDDLSHVLSDEGGSYVRQYMAVEQKEATTNFKNMLSLNAMYQDIDSAERPPNWTWDYSLTKSKLIYLLDKTYAKFYPTTTQSTNLNLTPFEIIWKNIFKTSLPPSSKQTREQPSEEKLGQTPRHEDKIAERIIDQIVPAHTLYTETERVKRDSTGAVSRSEYCIQRGRQSSDGYVTLCTTCSHTTTLSNITFPRIINEAVCHSTTRGCMFSGSVPHGSCHQNVMYMMMLRKKAGSCMMVIHNGTQVLTDEWESYSQPIRISCECRIDKRSPFAQYVSPN